MKLKQLLYGKYNLKLRAKSLAMFGNLNNFKFDINYFNDFFETLNIDT